MAQSGTLCKTSTASRFPLKILRASGRTRRTSDWLVTLGKPHTTDAGYILACDGITVIEFVNLNIFNHQLDMQRLTSCKYRCIQQGQCVFMGIRGHPTAQPEW